MASAVVVVLGVRRVWKATRAMTTHSESRSERHHVTGTMTYNVVKCGRCPEKWEQLRLVGDRSGDWTVCPHCGWAAPTDMEGGPV